MNQPSDPTIVVLNLINAEIGNRQVKLGQLREQQIALESQIEGLREAQSIFERVHKRNSPGS